MKWCHSYVFYSWNWGLNLMVFKLWQNGQKKFVYSCHLHCSTIWLTTHLPVYLVNTLTSHCPAMFTNHLLSPAVMSEKSSTSYSPPVIYALISPEVIHPCISITEYPLVHKAWYTRLSACNHVQLIFLVWHSHCESRTDPANSVKYVIYLCSISLWMRLKCHSW